MSTFHETQVKATRKRHWCYGCDKEIAIGSAAMKFHGIQDGEGGWSIYFCPKCTAYREKIGREKFMKQYNECVYDECGSMDLCENDDYKNS